MLDLLDLLFGRLVLFCLPLACLFACLLSLAYLVCLLALYSLLSFFLPCFTFLAWKVRLIVSSQSSLHSQALNLTWLDMHGQVSLLGLVPAENTKKIMKNLKLGEGVNFTKEIPLKINQANF